LDYFNYETKYALSEKLVMGDDVFYEYEDIVKFARCFADIIDCRSPFTYNHSNGIAKLAREAAVYLGYDKATQDKIFWLSTVTSVAVMLDVQLPQFPQTGSGVSPK